MIYTITLNPAIDQMLMVNEPFDVKKINYYREGHSQIGGKGINVGIVLKFLQQDVTLLGLMGMENQDIFRTKFQELQLTNYFFMNKGKTRTNFKINSENHEIITLNGEGFHADAKLVNDLISYLEKNLKSEDVVVLSGSIPLDVENDVYARFGSIVNKKGATLIVDTADKALELVLKEKPFLIKPNKEEMIAISNETETENISAAVMEKMAKDARQKGARNILLSDGENGAWYFAESEEIYYVSAAKGTVINSVGSGDSMVAGFIYGMSNGLSLVDQLKFAAACGGATAFNPWLAPKKEAEKLIDQIIVEKIN